MPAIEQVDKDFLEYVVKAIVSHPETVEVERVVDEMGVLLTLKVHPEDMGQVIGKQGTTAKAVRTILKIIGVKNNARINLKIHEPEGGRVRPAAPSMQEGVQEAVPTKGVDEVVDELKL